MPAMHLMSVDLPAPLSPTRAITSPARTLKSTWVRACTAPNDLEMPRSSSTGPPTRPPALGRPSSGRPSAAVMSDPRLLAGLGVLARAELVALDEPVGEDGVLDVVLGHRDRGEQRRRRVAQGVVGRQHAVDLVRRLLQHLLEDGQRLLVVPAGNRLVGDLDGLAVLVHRLEDRVVALREQR